MASALGALANASAAFQVVGEGVITDPDTGNVLPAGATVTTPLFLKAETVRGSSFPGVEVVEIIYDGYALEPLDSRVVIGTTGTLEFAGASGVAVEVTAVRMPYGAEGLLGETLNAALGERIQLIAREQMG